MISIIIVHYHVKKELLRCLTSVIASKPRIAYEIIVVDNDEKKTIERDLKKQFPKVRYIKNDNKGFGQGNNIGASLAKGEYLFFLNPDTEIEKGTVDTLVAYLNSHRKTAIVAPMLYNMDGSIVPLQGARELTPLRAVFSFSFITKFFPKNPVANDYWYRDEWDKQSIKEVDSIPGTAFVVRKEIYERIQGFDEKFFLYFEENDLCKRIREQGWDIVMQPKAKVFHTLGSSTSKSKKDVNKIFQQSRFYYLRKHFGFLQAFIAETLLRCNKYWLLLFCFIALGAYLRFVHLDGSMAFIGDQGWYYLSARDLVTHWQIPLVGIPSSHPWLHQGAFWTYLLAGGFSFFGFNPFIGVCITILFGLLSVIALYKLGSAMFSRNIGFIAAGLYATSPLIVLSDRMPYHTSPIPFVTILALYCLYQWIKGNLFYFPILIFMLAVLYNFEIATFPLSIFIMVLWVYGFMDKKEWARNVLSIKYQVVSIIAFVIPMMPMLIYDIGHGFPQTLKFFVWVGYRILVFFGYPPINPITPVSFSDMGMFLLGNVQGLLFASNGIVAFVLFLGGIFILFKQLFGKGQKDAYFLLFFINIFLLVGLFIVKTPSDAYLPMFFPGTILMLAVLLSKVRVAGIIGMIGIMIINSYMVVRVVSVNDDFSQKLAVAKHVVKEAGGKEYTIKGTGPGSEFESFTMGYAYLTWWLGNEPSKIEQPVIFIISEEHGSIQVKKQVSSINK